MDEAVTHGDPIDELPEGGPGLAQADGLDPVATTAAILVGISLIPVAWFQAAFTAHALGPIDFPVILAIAGVLFGFVAILRSAERHHMTSRKLGILCVALGLLRVLIYPLAGW